MPIILIVAVIRTDPILQTKSSALDQRLEDKGVRLLISVCTVALLLLITTPNATAQQGWSPQGWLQTGNRSNDWWVEVGAAAFDRPSEDLGLGLLTNSVTNEVLFSGQDLTDLETSFGVNVAFGGRSGYGTPWAFESTVVNWDEQHTFTGANLSSPFLPGITPFQVDVGYDSDLYSLELVTKRTTHPGVTWSFGPRYYRLEERVTLASQTLATGIFGPFTLLNNSNLETTNSLIGLQAGIEFDRAINQVIHFTAYGKFGGYTNRTEFDQITTNNLVGTTPVVSSLGKSTGSFIGEVGGKLYMDIVPGAIQSFVGYEASWVDGIALAPAQAINFGDPNPMLETANTLFYHQINFGFTITR